jgi:hypothetical protein
MAIVLKLGPVETDEGPTFIYPVLTPSGPELVPGKDDGAALDRILAKWGPAGLSCEPGMTRAAKKQGVPVEELDGSMLRVKALLALGLGLEQRGSLPMKSPPLLGALLQAAIRFHGAEPWDVVEADAPVRIRLSGALDREYEAAVLGALGQEYGLVLYEEPGAIAQVGQLVETGELEGAGAVRSLAVLLADEPAWVADAVEEAEDVRVVPRVMKLVRGEPGAVTEQELSALVAALNAVADLAERKKAFGTGECSEAPKSRARAEPAPVEAAGFPTPQAKVGRNDPCPCGSRQKFKKCHGAAGKAELGKLSRSGWHDVDTRLAEELSEQMEKREGKGWLTSAARELYGKREPWAGVLIPWALFDRRTGGGKRVAELFLEERGASLSPLERRWLQAQLRGRWEVWEVLSVDRDTAALELVGLLSGARARVMDVAASKALSFRDAMLARLVTPEGEAEALMGGSHTRTLPPEQADEVVRKVGAGKDPVALLAAWDEAVSSAALKAASPMVFKNTDGHPTVFVEDEFEVARGRDAEVKAALLAQEGAELDEDDRRGWGITFTRPGNAVHQTWKATVLGGARLTGKALTLTSNSVERADVLRRRAEAAAGEALRHRRRKKTAPPDARGGKTVMLDAQPMVGFEWNSEAAVQSLFRGWLDEPLPALEGRAPRQALEDDDGRRRVHLLLKEMEHAHGRDPTDQQPDPGALRRELGLDVTGGRAPHHELDLSLGAGRKLSETLIDFAQPLLGAKPDTATLRRAMEVAIPVWNAVVEAQEAGRRPMVKEAEAELKREGVKTSAPHDQLEALIARKQQAFGPDLRRVGRWSVERVGPDQRTVWMETRVPPELVERAKRAGIAPPR